MSNGFEFVKSKYQGLSVVKINNTTVYRDRDRLERAGVMFAVTSSLSMRGDFYIPMDRFADVFPNIESMFNSSVVHAQDSDGNFVIATQANSGENNVSLVNDEAEAYIKKNEVYAQAAPDKDWPEGVSHVSERARGTIPGQINLFGENDYSPTPGRGDATYAERIISNKGKLEFIGAKLTGPPEIKSPEDVAFLFKNLESAATENAFVVLIDKDNKYKVLYLSTGRTNATIVDIKLVAAAAQEFNAQSVYFCSQSSFWILKCFTSRYGCP
jgi:hypothetical protein